MLASPALDRFSERPLAIHIAYRRMDFEASVAIHPTIAEEFVTFGGWGQEQDKDPKTGAEIGRTKPYVPPYLLRGI